MEKLVIYMDHEGDFYTIMGKFFANRVYAQEMGGWQFYTKEGSIWFVLLKEENNDNKKDVIGFCSIIREKTHLYFDNMYVIKEHRNKGYGNTLFNERLKYALTLNKEIRVITDNPIQINRYLKNGFIQYGNKGRYTKFRRIYRV